MYVLALVFLMADPGDAFRSRKSFGLVKLRPNRIKHAKSLIDPPTGRGLGVLKRRSF